MQSAHEIPVLKNLNAIIPILAQCRQGAWGAGAPSFGPRTRRQCYVQHTRSQCRRKRPQLPARAPAVVLGCHRSCGPAPSGALSAEQAFDRVTTITVSP
jgi:hypothetical protein